MYSFPEINNFVVANGGANNFAADFSLYRKIFPESNLLSYLENAIKPRHKELDERMLLEMLKTGKVEFNDIIKNRVGEKDTDEEILTEVSELVERLKSVETPEDVLQLKKDIDLKLLKVEDSQKNQIIKNIDTIVAGLSLNSETGLTNPFIAQLQKSNIEELKYNEMKKMVFGLKLKTDGGNTQAYKAALLKAQAEYGVKKN